MVLSGLSSLSSKARETTDEDAEWMDIWCPSIHCVNGLLSNKGPFTIYSPWRRNYCSKCGKLMSVIPYG